jgi:hypothetical protein
MKLAGSYLKTIVAIALFESARRAKLRLILLGMWDGLRFDFHRELHAGGLGR